MVGPGAHPQLLGRELIGRRVDRRRPAHRLGGVATAGARPGRGPGRRPAGAGGARRGHRASADRDRTGLRAPGRRTRRRVTVRRARPGRDVRGRPAPRRRRRGNGPGLRRTSHRGERPRGRRRPGAVRARVGRARGRRGHRGAAPAGRPALPRRRRTGRAVAAPGNRASPRAPVAPAAGRFGGSRRPRDGRGGGGFVSLVHRARRPDPPVAPLAAPDPLVRLRCAARLTRRSGSAALRVRAARCAHGALVSSVGRSRRIRAGGPSWSSHRRRDRRRPRRCARWRAACRSRPGSSGARPWSDGPPCGPPWRSSGSPRRWW